MRRGFARTLSEVYIVGGLFDVENCLFDRKAYLVGASYVLGFVAGLMAQGSVLRPIVSSIQHELEARLQATGW